MRIALVVLAALVVLPSVVVGDEYETWYEKSGFKETPRYAETVEYTKRLAAASRWLHYTSYGTSPQGRELPLLIADKDRTFDPARVSRGRKAVVLIQACIHAGESDGKDAGLMLLRDIAVRKELSKLLDHTTILFQPIFNVDGHERFGPYNRINQDGPTEMGYRVTAQRLNLNRDYLKLDSPEMRAFLELYNAWQPDFYIDCHATDGADYQYVMTHIMETQGRLAPSLTTWVRDEYLTTMNIRMSDSGFPMVPYVFPLEWPDLESGLQATASSPRFSTGYAAIRNRPALLIETHMIKDYKTRVTGTYELLRHTLEYLNVDYQALHTAIVEAEKLTASRHFRDKPYALQYTVSEEAEMVSFEGFETTREESDLTGGPWFKFSDKPKTYELPFHSKVPSVFVDLPEAYIIPPEWTDVIERMQMHGVKTRRLATDHTMTVDSYRFQGVSWAAAPFEGRHLVTFQTEKMQETRTYPAGSVVVDMNQAAARVIAHVLEPQGPDSFVLWGFFNGIFEQKEYGESYVMEKLAREMLANDRDLRERYEKMKTETDGFADNPQWQLNWFYQQSPYWDDRINVYPVGKIFDPAMVADLPLK